MAEIQTGSLKIEGYEGISKILGFSMTERPGEHSRARITGRAARTLHGRWAYEGPVKNHAVTIFAGKGESPLYAGILQEANAREEDGVHLVELELASGTILMDLEKKDHSYQDAGMSYGALIRQAAAQGGGGAVCPPLLDMASIGHPRIQYRETDWAFIKRMASHFGFSVYPEPLLGGAGVYVGVPETGVRAKMNHMGYTAILDRRYHELGGEASGHARGRLLTYEVESGEDHGVGERTLFKGRELAICAKECRTEKGELRFRYRLARPEWAGTRRLGNGAISGLSLLGTVLSRRGGSLCLKLDIDGEHPDQGAGNAYPFPWAPATGNLMYLMPEAGSRVSLYFKGGEETGALAVNCIRQGGEGAGKQPHDRSLVTEHGKRLELQSCSMGLISLDSRVMLDDQEGLTLEGGTGIQIAATGKVAIKGKDVSLEMKGEGKISLYHGHVTLSADEELSFEKDAEFHMQEEGKTVVVLGNNTYMAAYKHEDYSGPEYRFRDDPVEEDYDFEGLIVRVMGGMVIVGGVTIASGGIAALAGISATPVMTGSLIGGGMYVGGMAVTDLLNGQVSGMDKYVKAALAGSVIGALTGAAQLVPMGNGMLGRMGMDALTGMSESALSQLIMEGKIDPERVLQEGLMAVIMGMAIRELCGGSGSKKGRENESSRAGRTPPSWNGSGPVAGVIGVNENSKSIKSLLNYNPKDRGFGRAIEFVFDAETNTFVVGKPKSNSFGSPHQKLAEAIGANSNSIDFGGDPTVVGGMFSRGTNGEIFTNEYSGHFGKNWTPEIRAQYQETMKKYGVEVIHESYGS